MSSNSYRAKLDQQRQYRENLKELGYRQVSTYVSRNLHSAISDCAAYEGASMSRIMQKALQEYAARNTASRPGLSARSAARSGRRWPNTSGGRRAEVRRQPAQAD